MPFFFLKRLAPMILPVTGSGADTSIFPPLWESIIPPIPAFFERSILRLCSRAMEKHMADKTDAQGFSKDGSRSRIKTGMTRNFLYEIT
jgi:hypothetical protein